MIGKPEWFTYRIAGWGVRPRTKEGWIYTFVALFLFMGVLALPVDKGLRTGAILVLGAVFIADVLHITTQLPKVHDERENYLQLLVERNSSFAGVSIAVLVLFIEIFNPASLLITVEGGKTMNASGLGVLAGMGLAKLFSSLYLRKKI